MTKSTKLVASKVVVWCIVLVFLLESSSVCESVRVESISSTREDISKNNVDDMVIKAKNNDPCCVKAEGLWCCNSPHGQNYCWFTKDTCGEYCGSCI